MSKPKPKLLQHVFLEKKIIGAVMLDSQGYFYRPKYNSISVAAHNSKKDGEHFSSLGLVLRSVHGEE